MSSFNNNHGKPYSPPAQTPVPLPTFPGFTHRGSGPSSTTTPSRNAPVSLPRISGPTHHGSGPSVTSTPNHHPSSGQSPYGASGSSTPGAYRSQAKSSRMHTSGFEIMLPAPATPHQYEAVDEPEDELLAADELVLRPQPSKKLATVARERSPHPPDPNIRTPVPLPKTTAPQRGRSTPQPRSGASTPGSRSGNKGRPKGWKPGMSYAAVRNFGPEVAAQFAAMNKDGNRPAGTAKLARAGLRRKPARAAAPAPGTQAVKPPKAKRVAPQQKLMDIYMELGIKGEPFRCEWEGCQSRLHNLNTLERHVVIVHCRGKKRECLWRRCAYTGVTFDTDEEMAEHLREEHFIPYAWHLGDGPKISFGIPEPDSKALPVYLFDKSGNQVTESIQGQVVEDDATRVVREAALKEAQLHGIPQVPFEVDSEDEDEAMVLGWSIPYP